MHYHVITKSLVVFILLFIAALSKAVATDWYIHTFSDDSWIDELAYGNGVYVAVGAAGIRYSEDLVEWSFAEDENTFFTRYKGVTFANGLFAAVGSDGIVSHSTDGLDWESSQYSEGGRRDKIVYGNGIWLASGSSLIASTDLLAWNEVLNVGGVGMAYGGDKFVFISWSDPAVVYNSADGTDWTEVASLPGLATSDVATVTFGNGQFVAAGDKVYTSSNGIDWTVESDPPDVIYGVAYGNGQYYAVGNNSLVLTSNDGITWTERRWLDAFDYAQLDHVHYFDGRFIATGGYELQVDSAQLGGGVLVTEKDEPVDANATIFTSVEISFSTAFGRIYQIERSLDMETWSVVESSIIGTGDDLVRFYSIRTIPKSFWRVSEVD